MKLRNNAPFTCALLLAAASAARATDLYWDTNGAAPGVGNASPSTWTTDPQKFAWSTYAAGNLPTTFWTNNDDAFFAGPAGNVAINGTVIPRSITVSTDGYQFSGGNITLSATANGNVSNAAPGTSSFFIASGVTATFQNNFVGNMDLYLPGPGTAVLAAANPFFGNVLLLGGGTLQLNDDAALGDAANTFYFGSGGTLQTTASHTFAQPLVLAADPLVGVYTFTGPGISFLGNTTLSSLNSAINVPANSSLSLAGAMSGNATLDKKGGGTLTFSGAAANPFSGPLVIDEGAVQLNKSPGVQAFSGPITINGPATLSLLASNQIADTANVTLNGGASFNLNNASESIGSLAGAGAVNLGNGILTINQTIDTTFSGTFSGNGTLFHRGLHSLGLLGNLGTFSALNNWSGATVLAAGSLTLTSTGETGFHNSYSSLFVENGSYVAIQGGFALTTYATPSVHNSGAIYVDGPTTSWTNLDAPGFAADIRIGYAGGLSTLSITNAAHVSSQSYISIGGHRVTDNIGYGSILVQSGASLTASLGLNMDANSTLTIEKATATLGGLSSAPNASPSIFLTDPSSSVSALTFSGNGNTTFTGTIADGPLGPGGITMNGTDRITLSGQNTYTGPTRVLSGILSFSAGTNNSPVEITNAMLLAKNTTWTPQGDHQISAGSNAVASFQNCTVTFATLTGAGYHSFSSSTLKNSYINADTTVYTNFVNTFDNVTDNGQLVIRDSLTWNNSTIAPQGVVTLLGAAVATSLSSSGTMYIQTGGSLTVGGDGLLLDFNSITKVGTPTDHQPSLTVTGTAFDLHGFLENDGAVTGNITIYYGGLAVGPGTYTAAHVFMNGSITFASNQNLSALQLDGGAAIITAGTTKTAALSFAGAPDAWSGQLELGGNPFILQSSNAAKDADTATLRNLISYGKSHDAGITNAVSLPAHTTLAVIDNGSLPSPFTTFANQPVDSNSLLITPALLGDANFDGRVDLSDLSTLLNHFGQSTPQWTSGNFDNAPTINLTDLSYVLNNFGLTFTNASQLPVTNYQLPATTAPAPEPASLALFLPLALFIHRRRRD
ncbi:MAG: beta strand repeat-containing protein [Phycisphaerae bacterium]